MFIISTSLYISAVVDDYSEKVTVDKSGCMRLEMDAVAYNDSPKLSIAICWHGTDCNCFLIKFERNLVFITVIPGCLSWVKINRPL